MKLLFIGAHTDDIELGCGGAIARMVEEGHEVWCLVLSDCQKKVLGDECYDSLNNVLQVVNVAISNFPVRDFGKYRQEILDVLIKQRDAINPDQVFTHSQYDRHQDHWQVAVESLRAFRNYTMFTYSSNFNRLGGEVDMYVKLSEGHMNTKIAALLKYESQNEREYMQPNHQLMMARITGALVGLDFAEGFEVVKQIV